MDKAALSGGLAGRRRAGRADWGAAIRGRLANPQFLASAGEEVVDEARTRAETLEAEAAQISAALGRLRAMG